MKQLKPRIWLGAIISQAARAQFYVGLVQSFLVAAAAYQQVRAWFPWINFWVMAGVLLTVYIVAGVVDYIIGTPAVVAFQNEQVCRHVNPQMKLLIAVAKKSGINTEEYENGTNR